MNSEIKIIQKPDWISWDDIHSLLWAAHSVNREKGILMKFPSLPGEEIRKRVEGNGKMFCAIKEGKLVGTGAVIKKKSKLWFDKSTSDYLYFCFAGVLPEYKGQGIYKMLNSSRLKESNGFDRVMFDTHEDNKRLIDINKKNGFVPVEYRFYNNHFNVVMVKWLNGCPYSILRCKYEFFKIKFFVKLKYLTKLYIQTLKCDRFIF